MDEVLKTRKYFEGKAADEEAAFFIFKRKICASFTF
jgi:hypothetical protein